MGKREDDDLFSADGDCRHVFSDPAWAYELRTVKVELGSVKEPDVWTGLASELGLTEEEVNRFFEFGEYADLELIVGWNGSELGIYGGRIVPRKDK